MILKEINGDPKDFCYLLHILRGDREVFFSNLEKKGRTNFIFCQKFHSKALKRHYSVFDF